MKSNTDKVEEEKEPLGRGILARIGLSLLSLLVPGSGLIRIGHLRNGLLFLLVPLALSLAVILFYQFGPVLSFPLFLAVVAVAIINILIFQVGSAFLTFRKSKHRSLVSKNWSAWYVIISIFILWFGLGEILASQGRTFYRPFFVPAQGMSPTLLIDDKFLAKMSDFGEIKRGDVLIVKNLDSEYVKRVVGLPGDTFEMRAGHVYINGSSATYKDTAGQPDSRICDTSGGSSSSATISEEMLPGTASTHLVANCGFVMLDDYPATALVKNQFFFLGDNRDMSADSRVPISQLGMGIVTRDRIIGKALFFHWSNDRSRIGTNINP